MQDHFILVPFELLQQLMLLPRHFTAAEFQGSIGMAGHNDMIERLGVAISHLQLYFSFAGMN